MFSAAIELAPSQFGSEALERVLSPKCWVGALPGIIVRSSLSWNDVV